jgi:predicted secreted protein
MMGVGGTTTYRFRAEAPGTQTLEFAYLRAWELGVPPVRTARFDVTVTPAGWQNWF